MHVLNPNFSASFNLFSIKLILLTSPVNPTSPITTVDCEIGTFLYADATVAIIPKSTAGSDNFIPPAIFKYTS